MTALSGQEPGARVFLVEPQHAAFPRIRRFPGVGLKQWQAFWDVD